MKNFDEYLNKNDKFDNDEIYSSLIKFIDNTSYDWNYITPQELNQENLKDYYLLDLRKKEDYQEGHIQGSKNIFWKDLLKKSNLKKLPKEKKIILICYVGHTASQMLVVLKLLGYDVRALKFGMGKSPVKGVPVAGWLDYGYNITKD